MSVTLVTLLLILQLFYAGTHPTCPFPTIEAVEDDDVALQCRLDNLSARTLDVARAVRGTYGDVCSYRKRKDRMDRCGGFVALLSHGGEYKVFLQKLRARSVVSIPDVSKNHQNGTKTVPPVEEVTESNSRGGGNGKAARSRIVPAVVFILGGVLVVVLVNTWKDAPSLRSTTPTLAHNFAETLPIEMSAKIFGMLDAESLSSAARTCRLWHYIIAESEQVSVQRYHAAAERRASAHVRNPRRRFYTEVQIEL
ncbi:uncharacterized protein LOC120563935 isoform X1 [Perca fluviatilis]|uniref:uncharacterized protein LOC120563935 isoform X1 n=1 Tax=Perca fluviatilis TaxID=8168 RepID=UPI001962BE14|nr:uncharacterized protein LOC120563935 isoform X1 [Perca fluviatilis]